MQSLSVKYRPNDWGQVCGQKSVIKILSQQIEQDAIQNAYLFSGSSGCGKTTLARIFANKINSGKGKPIEIDGASNNGVDNVKTIIKSAAERSLDGKYKIYIIDECHMITTQGWNAFLKCIEEPPTYTIFIFCTTDPQKIPNTIMNRVQQFHITKINEKEIEERLKFICKSENFMYEDSAIEYIAKISNGGMRDSIANLEKCSGYSKSITMEVVEKALGNFSYGVFFNLVNAIVDGNAKVILDSINYEYENGNDLKIFVDQFLSFCLDIAKYTIYKSFDNIKIPSSMQDMMNYSIGFDNPLKYYMCLVNNLLDLKFKIKDDSNIKSTIEIVLLRCAGVA